MGKYTLFLLDNIGNKYERKNLYLKELAIIDDAIKNNKSSSDNVNLKKKREELVKNKNKNEYLLDLKEFNLKEKKFFQELKAKKRDYVNLLDNDLDSKVKDLTIQLFESRLKENFYKDYVDLDYKAEFNYLKYKEKSTQLPSIIEYITILQKEIQEATTIQEELEKQDSSEIAKSVESFKREEREKLKSEIDRTKGMHKEGIISKKAERNGIAAAKREYKNAVALKKYEIPTNANKQIIKSKKHELKMGIKRNIKILNGDIADIRRRIPVEVEKTSPIFSFLTIPFPGVGQALNKQFGKSIIFLLASLFIYLIAIPYALGYGNYQGEGIAGLINLAEGGPRIYKSLIFMIEGVVAIFFVLIAAALLAVSFKDVYRVEKNTIKGIRNSNWFETKRALKQDGFPYLVSFPALIIIVFIVLVPVITTFLLSLTNMNPQNQSKFSWIGIDNYKLIATGEGLAGSVFWLILVWTIIWTLLATTLAISIGFFLALLVNNDRIKAKKFFRTIYLLPWAVPAFITIMFFSIMVAPGGTITVILEKIVGGRVEIKNSPLYTRSALILLQGWLGSAYVFLLTTGVLQAIPGDLYEAADIDGASSWDKTRRITIPLVLFQIAPLLVTQYTFNFNNFSVIFLFNEGGPFNPQRYGNLAGSSDLLISYIYKLAMVNQYQAVAAAITMFISLGLMFFAFLGFRNSKGFKEGRL